MRKFLESADILIGHNIVRFDIVVLERLLGIKIKAKLVDTLALSWYLFPKRKRDRHGLAWWGEDLGVEKPKIDDWEGLTYSEYEHRCEEDVKINNLLWKYMWNKLLAIYKSEKEIWRFTDYISFKMHCAMLQEKSGWKVDVEYCSNELVKLLQEKEEKIKTLTSLMPKVPIYDTKTKPKKMTNKKGGLTKLGLAWLDFLSEQNLPLNTEGEVRYIVRYEEGNPNSTDQIKSWLFGLGWKPRTFKEVKNKETKEVREIPQINLEFGRGICDSIKELFEIEPELEVLDGLSVLNHRIPILRKMLSMRDEDDYVKATVQGLTNTLRFQHADPCVNLPKPEKKYALPVRGSLIAQDGYVLVGADMSSLEDRLKQHYIYPLDPEYVRKMMREDFDPHLELAIMARRITLEEKHFYQKIDTADDDVKKNLSLEEKNEFKRIKTIRGIFKTGNYAAQYGAYPPRLSKSCGISMAEAQELFDAYWNLNWAVKKAAEQQRVIEVDGELWLQNPINKFFYSLRSQNDRFSTLVQGTASYVFDMWVKNILEEREQLTAQFHDEIVVAVKQGNEHRMSDLCNHAISQLNSELKLNRELAVGVQYGQRYSEIH